MADTYFFKKALLDIYHFLSWEWVSIISLQVSDYKNYKNRTTIKAFYILLLDDFDSMDSCLEMYLKSGKTSTPKRGKGQRISQKNYKYHSDSDKEDYEVQFGSHISKKVCFLSWLEITIFLVSLLDSSFCRNC